MTEGYIGSTMAARRVCPPRHGGHVHEIADARIVGLCAYRRQRLRNGRVGFAVGF